jgi:hypothetical protein
MATYSMVSQHPGIHTVGIEDLRNLTASLFKAKTIT